VALATGQLAEVQVSRDWHWVCTIARRAVTKLAIGI
jgi:hypothetical protein